MTVGVIVANTGSPDSPTPDDIEVYLRKYLMDPHIRQLPFFVWHLLVYKMILPRRKFSSAKRYQFVWGSDGSPLVTIQQHLCEKVEALYAQDRPATHDDVIVRSAMSYGNPSISTVLWDLRQRGVRRIVLFPLYPQSAHCITGSVCDEFRRALDEMGWDVRHDVIESYYENEAYLEALAASIRRAGYDPSRKDHLVMSFHAIPLKDERAGDTYREQTTQTARLVAQRLGIDPFAPHVAYQSVFGPRANLWTSPLATDLLSRWSDDGRRVVFCCPGFAVDCLETIYDTCMELVPALEGETSLPTVSRTYGHIERGINSNGRFVWVPSLNDTDEHAHVLKDVIDEALARP